MKVAIIGCGLIGQKRLRSLRADDQVVVVADPVKERAQALAAQARGAAALTDWRAAVERADVEVVFVSTSNDAFQTHCGRSTCFSRSASSRYAERYVYDGMIISPVT